MEVIAKSIRSLRELEGMSQQQLADAIGVTRSAVSMYENGNAYPKMEVLKKLAAVFGVSVASMFFEADKEAAQYGIQMESIPDDEYELLSCYRNMTPQFRALLLNTARSYSAMTIAERNSRNF